MTVRPRDQDVVWPALKVSRAAANTTNPIRAIVDSLKIDPANKLSLIPLSIGDPTLDGNLLPPQNYVDAICEGAKSAKFNGYPPAHGYGFARAAVAEYYSSAHIKGGPDGTLAPATADDVVLASGASGALELVVQTLLEAGDTLLLPTPCFSLYSALCANRGVNVTYYKLNPDDHWAIDLASLEACITPSVKAILIINPSNPCGSNFSRANIEALLAVAERHKLPIIADEIYAGLVFDVHEKEGKPVPEFFSIGRFTKTVPCFIIGGIAKTNVVPGHRLGWVLRHDPLNAAAAVWKGIISVAALVLGPNSLIQSALRSVLFDTPAEYRETLRTTLRDNARLCVDYLSGLPGLKAVEPQGAMYLLIRVDIEAFPTASGIKDDREFAAALIKAKNVVVLPGACFVAPGFIRVVFTKPADQLREALRRIAEFTTECMAAK